MGTRLERMPLCSAIMQIDRHTAYFSILYPEVFFLFFVFCLDTVACASSESSRAVGNLPLTLSPVLPTLSAGKGLGKSGFVTLMKTLSAAAALGGVKPGLQRRTDALQL